MNLDLEQQRKACFDGATAAVADLETFLEDHSPLSLIRNPSGHFTEAQVRDFVGTLEEPGEREVVGELPIQLHPFLFALSGATKLIAVAQRWDTLCALCKLDAFVQSSIVDGLANPDATFDDTYAKKLEEFKSGSGTEFSPGIAKAIVTVSCLQGVFDCLVKAMFGGTEGFLVCRGGVVVKVDNTLKARRISLAELLGAISQSQQGSGEAEEGNPPTS